ncbi:MAG: hypothetical protein ACJAZ2_001637 [Glaciecola sp.]|jgi:hypothetical protein
MNPKNAIKTMLWLLGTVVLFHLCIVLKIIPHEITWGGRLKNDSEMYVFEAVSITVNVFLIFVLLIKGKYLREIIPVKSTNITLWIFLVLFGLNTLGNALAKTNFEKSFTLLTLASAVLIWIILRKTKNETDVN